MANCSGSINRSAFLFNCLAICLALSILLDVTNGIGFLGYPKRGQRSSNRNRISVNKKMDGASMSKSEISSTQFTCNNGNTFNKCFPGLSGSSAVTYNISFCVPCNLAYLAIWAESSVSSYLYYLFVHHNTGFSKPPDYSVGPNAPSSPLLLTWVTGGEFLLSYKVQSSSGSFSDLKICYNYTAPTPSFHPENCVNGGSYLVPFDYYKLICMIPVSRNDAGKRLTVVVDATIDTFVYLKMGAGVSVNIKDASSPSQVSVKVPKGGSIAYVMVDTYKSAAGGKITMSFSTKDCSSVRVSSRQRLIWDRRAAHIKLSAIRGMH